MSGNPTPLSLNGAQSRSSTPSTPVYSNHSGSSTPAPTSSTAGSGGTKPSKPKPTNVFSNDGSFLERFQRSKKVGISPLGITSQIFSYYTVVSVAGRRGEEAAAGRVVTVCIFIPPTTFGILNFSTVLRKRKFDERFVSKKWLEIQDFFSNP